VVPNFQGENASRRGGYRGSLNEDGHRKRAGQAVGLIQLVIDPRPFGQWPLGQSTPTGCLGLNELGSKELSTMPKRKQPTGPMRTQPIERASIMPTQVLPMMPAAGKATKPSQPKQRPTRAEAVRAAKARITRRNSLRKQREALSGQMLPYR
jgi:hypothetical protein